MCCVRSPAGLPLPVLARTALLFAVPQGSDACDIGHASQAGWTPLMKASATGRKRIVNLLLTADRPARTTTANKVCDVYMAPMSGSPESLD